MLKEEPMVNSQFETLPLIFHKKLAFNRFQWHLLTNGLFENLTIVGSAVYDIYLSQFPPLFLS